MKIKPPKLNIPDDNPFAEDILERKESAQILTQFISTIKEPYVLAIDSPWGTGKTTFIQMWSQSLKKDDYPCIYINAWENDFSDAPLVSLIGEIDAGIEGIKLSKGLKTKAKRNIAKVKKVGSLLLKKSIPIIIKTATSGVVDVDKAYGAAMSEMAATTASDIIDKYSTDKKTIKEFKKSLSKFVLDVSPKDKKGNTKPLILFIDELDRCRPNFAIELLEKAKHFFNIDNIIFVLALDKEQLGHSIKSMYGVDMNVDGYLRRFIDLDYNLPETSADVFCNALFSKLKIADYFSGKTKSNHYKELLTTLIKLFKAFNFSLRDQEQCISRLNIVLRTTTPDSFIHPIFLGALIILKTANHQLYTHITKRDANSNDIRNFIANTKEGKEFLSSDYGTILKAYFDYTQHTNIEAKTDLINTYQQKLNNSGLSNENRVKTDAIFNLFIFLRSDCNYDIIKYLTKKIEIAEQFIQN
ncbi:Phage protein [hydrothermal vent metagenome]|uniref:Phage protein n=1 Tax=hydrothermal vent metagenome TaxID=652676 RepID=A0A3B0R1C4_9ZZZZ